MIKSLLLHIYNSKSFYVLFIPLINLDYYELINNKLNYFLGSYTHIGGVCVGNIPSQQVGTMDPLRVLNSSLITLHLCTVLHNRDGLINNLLNKIVK